MCGASIYTGIIFGNRARTLPNISRSWLETCVRLCIFGAK